MEVTRTYKDLFSFDSSKVRCLRLIKYLVVSFSQILSKNLVMDVVVVDIPPKFVMLLSISWVPKFKRTLQMHMSYMYRIFSPIRNTNETRRHIGS